MVAASPLWLKVEYFGYVLTPCAETEAACGVAHRSRKGRKGKSQQSGRVNWAQEGGLFCAGSVRLLPVPLGWASTSGGAGRGLIAGASLEPSGCGKQRGKPRVGLE